jgi:hypothetical protein
MKKWMIILSILLTVPASAIAQVKITIPTNTWEYKTKDQFGKYDMSAANVYLAVREDNLVDTIIYVYGGKKVYWNYHTLHHLPLYPNPDSIKHFVFSVDTIIGRGTNRQIKFTTSVNTSDSTLWVHVAENYRAVGDTATKLHTDTIGITTDSTFKRTKWLGYTSVKNHIANASGVGAGGFELWYMDDKRLDIWLERVTGDPTKNGGRSQRAMLHFQLREEPPQDWILYYMYPNDIIKVK